MESLETQFDHFVKHRRRRNKWINSELGQIYVRWSRRKFEREIITFFDIASVEIYDKGKGTFTAFLNHIEKNNVNLFVENVLSERFQAFFDRREGYDQFRTTDPFSACYIRLKQTEQKDASFRIQSPSSTKRIAPK